MDPIRFELTLSGNAIEVDRGQLWVETTAEDCGAVCRRRIEVWDDGSVAGRGDLSFSERDAISFRARGSIGASPDPHRRHGTAVLEVTGGRGRLAGARGYVTSNFLLSDTGALTDHHLGLVFVPGSEGGDES
jgi:hypothetical protein